MAADSRETQNRFWPESRLDKLDRRPNFYLWSQNPVETLQYFSWSDAAEHLIAWGLLAGNAHNKQPWRILISPARQSVIACVDPRAVGTPSDPVGRQAHIGLGCLTENIASALAGYDLIPAYHITPQGVDFDFHNILSGRLTYPEIFSIIKARRTYRGPFVRGYKIPREVTETLTRLVLPDLQLKLFGDGIIKNALLANLQFAANTAVLHLPSFRKELGEAFAPNETPLPRVMPGNTFGLTDADSRQLAADLKMGQISPKFAAGFPRSDKDAITSATNVGIITAPEDTPLFWISAGITLERIWLFAQKVGLGLGIMAGMVEVASKRPLLKQHTGLPDQPLVVFRLGKPEKPTWPHSPRDHLQTFISYD